MDTAQPSTSTTVQTEEQTEEKKRGVQEARQTSEPPGTQHLVLRLVPKKKRQKKKGVQWAENVVDNEFMGKKKSKKCCIFHKQRNFGEWSDSEDSEAECEECNNKEPDS